MNASKWDILGIGVAAVDDLFYVDHYPAPDTKMRALVEQRQGGGLTATAMVAAARLGSKAGFFGILGHDDLSNDTIRELEQQGVDCSPVIRRHGAGPYHSVVFVDEKTGSRTIVYSDAHVVQIPPQDVSTTMVAGCKLLFVDHAFPAAAIRAADIAHTCGIPVVADIETTANPGVVELMEKVDHLIVSYELAANITGTSTPEDMVQALAGPKRACAAVTQGSRGCWFSDGGQPVRHQPAFTVDVVDTTGCGDVFHGAYAASISRHTSVDDAIRIAAATAALKATQRGGRTGIPDWQTVIRFVREREVATS